GAEIAAALLQGGRAGLRDRDRTRRLLLGGLLLGAGAIAALAPQLLAWAYHFGPLRRPTTIEHLRPGDPALWEVLFSMRCGLLPWTPVAYLAAVGLALGLRRHLALL